MKKVIVIPLCVLVLALVLMAGALGGTSAASISAKAAEIRIGQIVDLTGPDSAVGKKQQKSLAFAVNYLGTVSGAQVTVVIYDSAGTAAGARDQAVKLITQDKVAALFGPTQTAQMTAVAAVAKKYNVPVFLYDPAPMSLFRNKYVVGNGGSTEQNPTCMASYLLKVMKVRTISTLAEKDAAGHSYIDPLVTYFKAHGGKVLGQKWVAAGTQDFTSSVTAIKRAAVLVAWVSGSDAVAFWNAYYTSGRYQSMPVVGAFHGGFTDGYVSMTLSKQVADAFIGVPSPMAYAPDSTKPVNVAFANAYKVQYGAAPGDDAESSPYQAYLVFKTAVEKAKGKTTAAAILSAVRNVRVFGPEGTLSYGGALCATRAVYIVKTVATNASSGPRWKFVTVKAYRNVPPAGLE